MVPASKLMKKWSWSKPRLGLEDLGLKTFKLGFMLELKKQPGLIFRCITEPFDV